MPSSRGLHTVRLWAASLLLTFLSCDISKSGRQELAAAAAAVSNRHSVAAAAATANSAGAGRLSVNAGSSNGFGRRLLAAPPPPAFRFHRLYTDGAMLSAAGAVVVGFGAPFALVSATLSLRGKAATSGQSRANNQGRWTVPLGRPKAGVGYLVTATTRLAGTTQTLSIRDVQVGQLWLLAGQSNVVMSLRDITLRGTPPWKALATTEVKQPAASIRIYRVPWANSSQAAADLPQKGFITTGILTRATAAGRWERLEGGTLQTASALGVLLANQLQQRLRGTPVGIVQVGVGSTSIQRWLPPATLRAILPPGARTPAADPRLCLFNSMVAPLRNVALDGVVWYQMLCIVTGCFYELQGESDTSAKGPMPPTSRYQTLLRGLMSSWRSALAQPRLPFYVIQLPGYNSRLGDTFARVREAQRQAVLHTAGTHLVATFDTDTAGGRTLHPDSKLVVAQRLAGSILAAQGVKGAPATGPTLSKAVFTRGGAASLTFAFHAGGLRMAQRAGAGYKPVSGRTPVRCFELKGGDGRWHAATGRIVGADSVQLGAPDVGSNTTAAGVRYAWGDLPIGCNLYSRALLPAVPFVED